MMSEISIATGNLGRGHRPIRIRLQRANVRLSFRLEKHQEAHHGAIRAITSGVGALLAKRSRCALTTLGPTGTVTLHPVHPHQPAVLLTELQLRGHVAEGRGGPDRHWAGETDPHSVASRADAASPPTRLPNPEPPARSSERPYRFAVCVDLVAAGLGWPRRGIAAHHSPDTRFA